MPLFTLKLEYTAVVAASNTTEAAVVAKRWADAIVNDSPAPDVSAIAELTSAEQLAAFDPSWNDGCLPYGGAENLTIADYLERK